MFIRRSWGAQSVLGVFAFLATTSSKKFEGERLECLAAFETGNIYFIPNWST